MAHNHKKCHFNLIAPYTTILLDIKQIFLKAYGFFVYIAGDMDCMFVYISCHFISFHCCSRTAKGQVSVSEMDFLSAWIVSSSALPFLCLIWGKRIKCNCGNIVADTVAFSSPIHVQTIQLSWEPWLYRSLKWMRPHRFTGSCTINVNQLN